MLRFPHRAWRALLAGTALAVTLSGCINVEERVTIAADGSGNYEMRVLMDRTFIDALSELNLDGEDGGQSGPASKAPPLTGTDEDRAKMQQRFGPDAQIDPAQETIGDASYEGLSIKLPFKGVEQFNGLATRLAESDDASDMPALPLKLTVQGDTYTLRGQIDPLFKDDGTDDAAFAKLFFKDARRAIVLTLPGQVVSANADSRNGQTYTWVISGTTATTRQVEIQWRPAGNPAQSVNPTPPAPAPAAAR